MFDFFLIALTKRLTEVKQNSKEAKLPACFKSYLDDVNDKKFMEDLELIVAYLSGDRENSAIKKSPFFKAFAEFLIKDFSLKLDFLDASVVLLPQKERRKLVDKIINSESELAETLKNILQSFTYHQISAEIYEISKQILDIPYILIQSPREIDLELKREIRKKLESEEKYAFPIFQTNQKLIGGIRVFKDGESIDHSWLSKVYFYTSLTKA